jgi:8-oxo-dGTP diphosphatase
MIIEILARGIVQDSEGRVLVCQNVGRDYFYFPGGHVETGETCVQALNREFQEELGVSVKTTQFIGGSEHQFVEAGIARQEINIAFATELSEITTHSKEAHMKFFLFTKEELKEKIVFPEKMKQAVIDWLETKKSFWVY